MEALLPLIYDELRTLAERFLRSERRGGSLDPTALVHEAYLRLADNSRIDYRSRTHFLALAAVQMRRILIDHARRRSAGKRGGSIRWVTFSENVAASDVPIVNMLALDQALEKLARRNPRRAKVLEWRLLSGMGFGDIASLLGRSERTVKEDWRTARAWLVRELDLDVPGGGRAPS